MNFLKERNYFIYRITKNGLLKVSSVNNITVDDEKDYLFTIRSESELINLFKLNCQEYRLVNLRICLEGQSLEENIQLNTKYFNCVSEKHNFS